MDKDLIFVIFALGAIFLALFLIERVLGGSPILNRYRRMIAESREADNQVKELRKHGRIAVAEVTDVEVVERDDGGSYSYNILYRFQTEEHGPDRVFKGRHLVTGQGSAPVMLIGGTVRIRYLPNSPSFSCLDTNP